MTNYHSFEQQASSIAFVDNSLSDADILLKGFRTDQVIMLDDHSNGIEQISQILEQYDHSLDSIHIFSPAEAGTLQLGNVSLDKDSLSQYKDELVDWEKALTDKGDLLLYGSNLAKKSSGRQLVRKIARFTGADVAASRDLTGSQSLGGDWELEYTKGNIEHRFSPANYSGLLSITDDNQPNLEDRGITKPQPVLNNNIEREQPVSQKSPDQVNNAQPSNQPKATNTAADDILNIQFETHTPGQYTENLVDQDWQSVAWANLGDRARIVKDSESQRGQVLEITYPKGAVGSRQGGSQFEVSLPEADELWLSYYVKFGEGFDFRKGGKLPGLTSKGSDYTGGRYPSDGDGWSARYMWKENGTAIAYPYYVDMQQKWGDEIPLEDVTFEPGQWHQITQHIKLNTDSKANGVLETWVDGKKVQSKSDMRLRLGNKGKIDSLYFSTFHGGKGSDWAPRVESKAFFDGFVVSKKAPSALTRQ